jgi:hypothetical protein
MIALFFFLGLVCLSYRMNFLVVILYWIAIFGVDLFSWDPNRRDWDWSFTAFLILIGTGHIVLQGLLVWLARRIRRFIRLAHGGTEVKGPS